MRLGRMIGQAVSTSRGGAFTLLGGYDNKHGSMKVHIAFSLASGYRNLNDVDLFCVLYQSA
jgi:hypothetical protein